MSICISTEKARKFMVAITVFVNRSVNNMKVSNVIKMILFKPLPRRNNLDRKKS